MKDGDRAPQVLYDTQGTRPVSTVRSRMVRLPYEDESRSVAGGANGRGKGSLIRCPTPSSPHRRWTLTASASRVDQFPSQFRLD